jgi:hypothetical protein
MSSTRAAAEAVPSTIVQIIWATRETTLLLVKIEEVPSSAEEAFLPGVDLPTVEAEGDRGAMKEDRLMIIEDGLAVSEDGLAIRSVNRPPLGAGAAWVPGDGRLESPPTATGTVPQI